MTFLSCENWTTGWADQIRPGCDCRMCLARQFDCLDAKKDRAKRNRLRAILSTP